MFAYSYAHPLFNSLRRQSNRILSAIFNQQGERDMSYATRKLIFKLANSNPDIDARTEVSQLCVNIKPKVCVSARIYFPRKRCAASRHGVSDAEFNYYPIQINRKVFRLQQLRFTHSLKHTHTHTRGGECTTEQRSNRRRVAHIIHAPHRRDCVCDVFVCIFARMCSD